MKYDNIKNIRKIKKMTQTDAANIINMSANQYSQYERGEMEIPLHHLISLARFYNVSMDYLCGLIDAPIPIHSSQEAAAKYVQIHNVTNSTIDVK